MKRLDRFGNLLAILAACLAVSTATTAFGQPFPGGKPGGKPGGRPLGRMGPPGGGRVHMGMDGKEGPRSIRMKIMKHLYPVEFVRHHAEEIALTDSQYEKLRAKVVTIKGEVEEISWDLDKEAQKLVKLVANGAKGKEVYAQMDKVFKFENKIKKLHLGLLLSVREILTSKQRNQLDVIKDQMRMGKGAGRRRPGKGRKAPAGTRR